MSNFEKINVGELSIFLEENRNDKTDEQFVDRFLPGAIASLKNDPKLYRSYGPYWWPLKRLILAFKDYDGFMGNSYDSTLSAAFSYDNDALTVCAAYNFQNMTVESGYMYSNEHQGSTTNGEVVEFVIEDEDMERLILAASFKF